MGLEDEYARIGSLDEDVNGLEARDAGADNDIVKYIRGLRDWLGDELKPLHNKIVKFNNILKHLSVIYHPFMLLELATPLRIVMHQKSCFYFFNKNSYLKFSS